MLRERSARRLVGLAAVLLAAEAGAHSTSTLDGIQHGIFDGHCATSGCHASGAGGLSLIEGESWGNLVLKRPTNTAAQDNFKFRVDPGRTWNSYLVDKLRGRFKLGEAGERGTMPPGGALDECAIREIERWILAGAPSAGYIDGDVPGVDPCDPTQPPLAQPAPPVPGEGVQVHVSGGESTLSLGMAEGYITRIKVFARAGTEHVTITPAGSTVPLMVARGNPDADETQTDSLILRPGSGIPFSGDLVVRQAFAGHRFLPAGVPEAFVNFHLASGVTQRLEPFVDQGGTNALFVPPRSLGATGGFWSEPAGARVAALRVWQDPRAVRATAAAASGVIYSSTAGEPEGYSVPDSPLEVPPGTGIAYACEHDNTHLVRQLRWGCGSALFLRGLAVPPPGGPGLAEGSPAPWCDEETDCPGDDMCLPANLVAGLGPEDGRCTLVGLREAAP